MLRLSSFALFLISVSDAGAWWDEGHLLVAAVAQKYLADQKVFDSVLKNEWPEFANFSDLTSGAVWLDHMKCGDKQKKAPFCQGLAVLPNLHLWDSWHFTGLVYNPNHVNLSAFDSLMPFYKLDERTPRDAVSFLVSADESLRSTKSVWTWNLLLRMALHIIGDMHQPLHTTSLYSKQFPSGDQGGNLIKIVVGFETETTNLHALWDAAAMQWNKSYPIDGSALNSEVQRVIGKYPPEYFIKAGRLSSDWATQGKWGINTTHVAGFFEGLTNDTSQLVPQVYAEYLNQAAVAGTTIDKPYYPTVEYLNLVKQLSDQQVALGGYRLASWLKSIQSYIPEHAPDQSDSGSSFPVGWVAAGAGGGLVLGLAGMFLFMRRKQKVGRLGSVAGTSLVTGNNA